MTEHAIKFKLIERQNKTSQHCNNIGDMSRSHEMKRVQHEKAATFLDILKSFFRPTLVRV